MIDLDLVNVFLLYLNTLTVSFPFLSIRNIVIINILMSLLIIICIISSSVSIDFFFSFLTAGHIFLLPWIPRNFMSVTEIVDFILFDAKYFCIFLYFCNY